jgi:hypothetical protein
MSSSNIKGKNPANNQWESVGKDSLTSTLRTIEIEHALSHDGKGYICSFVTSIANGANHDILMINPSSNFPHFRVWEWEVTGATCIAELHEGPFSSVGTGTLCDLGVTNRTSSNVSSLSVYIASSVTLDANSSTLLETHVLTGAKQTGGTVEGVSIEWILAKYTID